MPIATRLLLAVPFALIGLSAQAGDLSVVGTGDGIDLLRALVRHRGRLLTHRALLIEVWGPQYASDTQILRTHIANLRRKIEPTGERRYIRTDPGVGYRFAA